MSISFGTLLTVHVPTGTWQMKADRVMGKMPLAEIPISIWFRCLFILVTKMIFFFKIRAERGDSGYLEIAGILKIQDINTDTRLLFATSISYYLNTWVGAHGTIYLTNQCHILIYSAPFICPAGWLLVVLEGGSRKSSRSFVVISEASVFYEIAFFKPMLSLNKGNWVE